MRNSSSISEWRRQTLFQPTRAVLFFAVGIILASILAAVAAYDLESGDETRVAGIAAEMYLDGDYLVPHLNGEPFLEYPPMFYWCTAASYAVFGIHDFSAKIPSALAAAGCAVLLLLLTRKLRFSKLSALLAVVILMTSAQFFAARHNCIVDIMLSFFLALGIYGFYSLFAAKTPRAAIAAFLLFAGGLTGGVYTKGLIGIVIPTAVFGVWLVAGDIIDRKISWRMYGLLAAGVFLSLLAASAWYLMILARDPSHELFHEAFFVNNLDRFTGAQGDHVESFAYYWKKLPTIFCPWIFLIPFAAWYAGKKILADRDRELLLLLCSVFVPFVILNVSSSKRILYMLPISVPAAFLCSWFLCHLPAPVSAFFGRFRFRLPLPPLKLLCLVCIVLALISSLIDVCRAAVINPKKSLRPMFEVCRALEREGKTLRLMDPTERTRGAAFFYLGHHTEEGFSGNGSAAVPPPGEVWILRNRDGLPGLKPFADHHYLITSADAASVISPNRS